MPFLDSLDIANRACFHCGLDKIDDVNEDSQRKTVMADAYDKLRRTELRRNVWRFATRKTAIRAVDTTTLLLSPNLYDATRTYLIGEVVRDTNGLFWISEQADNFNNQPGGNNDAWDMYFGPATVTLYNSAQSYFAGEVVYVLTGTTPNGYQVYLSLVNGNTDVPGTATAYDSTAQYKQDDVVIYNTSQWRSLLPVNKGNTPADGPIAWASGTTYSASQQVTGSDNYIYTAVGSTTGNDPTTDNGSNWTNTGTLNAWSRTPTITTSSIKWRPLRATLKNIVTVYPLGAGPSSDDATRNIFRLPTGYLRTAPQEPKAGSASALGAASGLIVDDWEYQGNYIVSSQTDPIVFRFVADVTKVTAMDDMFCEGLACRMAIAAAPRLTQSSAKVQEVQSEYQKFMGEARTVNAIETGPVEPPMDDYIACRA